MGEEAEELKIRATIVLSQEEAFQAGMKVSLAEGPRAVLVKANDGKMLEVEDVLPLWVVIPRAVGLLRLPATSKASKPLFKVIRLRAVIAKGPKVASTKDKNVSTKQP
ncbi:hypothetical protein ACLOJK_005096 [Asimina triloba]